MSVFTCRALSRKLKLDSRMTPTITPTRIKSFESRAHLPASEDGGTAEITRRRCQPQNMAWISISKRRCSCVAVHSMRESKRLDFEASLWVTQRRNLFQKHRIELRGRMR